eukprot:TRINITY_DN2452_c2_g1_i1.p1 TRINITY_DN2452_c2_g1~~TRINITY_DN2452_c2_g1_i1.p1  ORF type:complete len:105 (-),score=0.30 TRINITY_DN2452_c2_g1_i1:455-769(-)
MYFFSFFPSPNTFLNHTCVQETFQIKEYQGYIPHQEPVTRAGHHLINLLIDLVFYYFWSLLCLIFSPPLLLHFGIHLERRKKKKEKKFFFSLRREKYHFPSDIS